MQLNRRGDLKPIARTLLLVTMLVALGACSTHEISKRMILCSVIGGAIGAAIGTGADDGGRTAGMGAAGALLGGAICLGNEPVQQVTDSDRDGVADGSDACPNTPRGARVDGRGCPTDSDGDGVYDGLDRCPGTPKGVAVDDKGCPLDSDRDGVPDFRDACPGTPAGVAVDSRGCPEVGERLLRLDGVQFAHDSAILTPDSGAILDRAVQVLNGNSKVRVRVEGHTDSSGGDEYNQRLSQRRASAVVDYLVAGGIDSGRLEPQGYGESNPIAPNDTSENRHRNRRVDLVVIE